MEGSSGKDGQGAYVTVVKTEWCMGCVGSREGQCDGVSGTQIECMSADGWEMSA